MQLTLTMAEARTSGWGMRRTGCWAKLDRESIPITRCRSGRPGRVWSVANPVRLEVGYSRPTGVPHQRDGSAVGVPLIDHTFGRARGQRSGGLHPLVLNGRAWAGQTRSWLGSSSSEKTYSAVHTRLRRNRRLRAVRSRFVGGEDQVSPLAEVSDREVLGHGGRTPLTALIADRTVTIESENRGEPLSKTSWLVMSCRGFETEAQAREFGEELRRATHLAGLCNRLGG